MFLARLIFVSFLFSTGFALQPNGVDIDPNGGTATADRGAAIDPNGSAYVSGDKGLGCDPNG